MKCNMKVFGEGFLKECKITCIAIEIDYFGIEQLARYDKQNKRIILSENVILKEYQQFFKHYQWNDFLKVLMAHEIGHSLDPHFSSSFEKSLKLREEMAELSVQLLENPNPLELERLLSKYQENVEITIKTEREAWFRGHEFIKNDLKIQYDEFNQNNVRRYEERFRLGREQLIKIKEMMEL